MRGQTLVALILAGALLVVAAPTLADEPTPDGDRALARRHAPVLYFHPQEVFRPQPVEVILEQARLRRSRRLWFDTNVLLNVDALDLFQVGSDRTHFLDVWYGDEGGSAYTNYSAHRAFYTGALSPAAGGPRITVYAHVARDEAGRVTLQYWALYFYNDWFNKHEGDWEMIQVMLEANGRPEWVVLSQHHGGTRRTWSQAPTEEGTRPVAYVALGSHANYFVGDEVYLNTEEVGDREITVVDRTGSVGRVVPDVILLPERDRLTTAPDEWPGAVWLPFRGRWGEAAGQNDFSGPFGPADKGGQWDQPHAWGMAQPLDTETWYANRLRVEVVGVAADAAQVELTDRWGGPLASAEALGNLALLHSAPPADDLIATIGVPPHTRATVLVTWPDYDSEQVTRRRFADVDFAETGLARLELGPDGAANLLLRCLPGEPGAAPACLSSLGPTEGATFKAAWDAPDFVWIGNALPAHRVAAGLVLAVLASAVPTALYVGGVYWLDRYEKEPYQLLTAAFLWGSLPALALALAAEVFFRLPPDLIGSGTLEAARLGLIGPLLQETLKAVAVLFIALRYSREFDNVLDGIIYGAVVGFGFAMTGNLVDHVSTFALWGFEGLNLEAVVEGLLSGLDHGLYTGTFGAGLGMAKAEQVGWRRLAWPGGGFGLAVATHALHNLVTASALGVNAVTLMTTGAGVALIGLIGAWSLRRQRQGMESELKDELPDHLYRTLVATGGGAQAQWQALRAGGLKRWRRTRRLHERCAELAFQKMHRRRAPENPGISDEVERLRAEIDALMTRGT